MRVTITEAASLCGINLRTFRDSLKRDGVAVWAPTPRGSRVLVQDIIKYLPPETKALVPDDMDWNDATAVKSLALRLAGATGTEMTGNR